MLLCFGVVKVKKICWLIFPKIAPHPIHGPCLVLKFNTIHLNNQTEERFLE